MEAGATRRPHRLEMQSDPAPTLIFGYGNPSRGDDAVGPLLVGRLQALQQAGDLPGVDLLTDFQLQIEHVLDLRGRERVVFVDAAPDTPGPFSWERVFAIAEPAWTTHSLSPGGLAGVFRGLYGPPPGLYLLAIHGACFELGAGLSSTAQSHLDAAVGYLLARLRSPGGI